MISKLFLRLYIIVVVTLVGVGWSLDRVLEVMSDEHSEPDSFAAALMLVNDRLLATPRTQWKTVVTELKARLELPIALEAMSSIVSNDGKVPGLARGEIVTIAESSGETYMQRVGNSDYFLSLGPIGSVKSSLDIEFILTAVFYICLAVAILLWIWPLWTNIRKLSLATASFGQGNFNARVNVPAKSAIAPLALTFNSMADRIQRLIDSHKELTNAVSHDLRTPLARMRFGIDMLENGSDSDARLRYINSMRTDVDELETLINEMLTYAKFDRDAPDLSMKMVEVKPWLEKITASLQPLSQNKKIVCEDVLVGKPFSVFMESAYMSRAVVNLVTNALRYAATTVRLSLAYSDDWLCVSVDDDGPGVPEQDRKRIFEAFTKQDSTRDRKHGGFGLGLSIASRIVQWHGGHIDVAGSPLGGAKFQIHLPLHKRSAKAA